MKEPSASVTVSAPTGLQGGIPPEAAWTVGESVRKRIWRKNAGRKTPMSGLPVHLSVPGSERERDWFFPGIFRQK